MKNMKQGPMENVLQGLDEQSYLLSPAEVTEELAARGVDVAKFLEEADALINSHLKADRTAWMKVADQRTEEMHAAQGALKSWVGRQREEIVAAFDALVACAQGQQSFAFRNKADLTVEDMARILDDFERLGTKPQERSDSDGK